MEFNRRVARYPCGICGSKCISDCLKCASCKLWFHMKCQSMSENELTIWGNIDMDYICVNCRTIDETRFDYFMGMERLRKAASTRNISELRQAAQREMLFNVKFQMPTEAVSDFPDVDAPGADVIDDYVDDVCGDPRVTTGDGDCLFNAISILLTGNENLNVQLRYHTCLNLLNKMSEYMLHPLRKNIQKLSSSYETTCLASAKIGTVSNSWTVLALADAISRPIRVIYPYANGKTDVAYTSLNTVFKHNESSGAELSILWHRMGCVPDNDDYYEVNHFSAVTDVEPRSPRSSPVKLPTQEPLPNTKDSEAIDLDSTETSTWRLPTRARRTSDSSFLQESEFYSSNRYDLLSDNDSDLEVSDRDAALDNGGNCISDNETANDKGVSGDIGTSCSDYDSDDQIFDNARLNRSGHENPLQNDTFHMDSPEIENDNEHKITLNSGRFLSNEKIINAIQETVSPCASIPRGPKNNVYIVVDYSANDGNRNEFVDDCGVWESGTTVNQYFVLSNGSVNNVYKKNSLFCQKKIVQKKLEYIPLNPQPQDVLTLHRYYAQLKGERSFRKRVTLVTGASGSLSALIKKSVVEYVGQTNKKKPAHGNSMSGESYKRTHPNVIRKAAEKVGEKSASQIVDEMAQEHSPSAPKSARQVQDRIHYLNKNKKEPGAASTIPRKNLGDDVLTVIGQLNANDFVQEVVLTKNRVPLVILYHASQIQNMKSNCVGENGSVIGVDRTFNLGRFFVTALSYKNRTVINRKTNQFPIFLGPLCLQWDGEQTSYQKFFDHVRDKLGSSKFTFGTDDEMAMRNSLKISFPDSDFLLCTKHLKDNIKNNLEKKGTCEKTVKEILATIFNEDSGLVFSNDDFEFAQREDDMSEYFNDNPHFRQYYDRHLAVKIRNFVYKPLKEKKITKLWTNNNAESINNRLKQETQHKLFAAPELIDKLSSVAQSQLVNLRRALYGTGNFKLYGKSEKLLLDDSVWHSKSLVEKQKQLDKLLSMSVPAEGDTDFVRSTDGHIKIKKPRQSAGKKPGQRRRPAAERTTNVTHR